MKPRFFLFVLVAFAATLTAIPLWSAQQVMSSGAVRFVSGGVGEDSEEHLKAQEKEFNLKLVFTLVEGNYAADVGVKIADAAGKTVIEHVADGPFFMAKLPAGAYTVTASYSGKAQTRKVKVGDRLRTEYLRWPSNPQTDFMLPPEKR
jgi:hypothetical protein